MEDQETYLMKPSPRPRITCVFEHPTLNGGERSLLEVVKRLRGAFHFAAFAPGSGPLWNELASLGIPTEPFEPIRAPVGPTTPAERTAAALASRVTADLVHGNSLSTAQFTGLLGDLLGVPAVSHVREIQGLNPSRVRRMERNRTLVAVSEAVRTHLLEEGVAAERIEVIHNGVALDVWNPGSVEGTIREELGIAASAPLIATIGQISRRKGSDVLMQAVIRLATARPSLHAVIVGERFSGKAENVAVDTTLWTRVVDAGLTQRIHFLGWRDDVANVLCDATALVHAARQEPLGRVLIEAAALERPIVATRVGGTEEIVVDGVTGWLVPPDDVGALAAQVGWVLDHAVERERAAAAGRQRAEELFSGELSAQRLAALYLRLLEG